jgi:hypothetical protein
MAVKDRYDLDFFERTHENAELLPVGNRRGQPGRRVADIGKWDRREMDSYLTRLILYPLKCPMQPALRYGQSGRSSWLNSINCSTAITSPE